MLYFIGFVFLIPLMVLSAAMREKRLDRRRGLRWNC